MDWDGFVATFALELAQDGPVRKYVFARGDGGEESLDTVQWGGGDQSDATRVAGDAAGRLRRLKPKQLRFTAWREDPQELFDAVHLRRAVQQLRWIGPTIYHQRFGRRLARYAREIAATRGQQRLRLILTPRERWEGPHSFTGYPEDLLGWSKLKKVPCWSVGWAGAPPTPGFQQRLNCLALTEDGWLLAATNATNDRGLRPAIGGKDHWALPELDWASLSADDLDRALRNDLWARRRVDKYREAVSNWYSANVLPYGYEPRYY